MHARRTRAPLILWLAAFCMPFSVFGQGSSEGTITGTVIDP